MAAFAAHAAYALSSGGNGAANDIGKMLKESEVGESIELFRLAGEESRIAHCMAFDVVEQSLADAHSGIDLLKSQTRNDVHLQPE